MRNLFLISSLLLITAAGCSQLRNLTGQLSYPEVEYQQTRFERITFSGVDLRFDFDVQNPNRLELRAESYQYRLLVDGRPLVEGTSTGGIRLDPRQSSRVSIPVTFTYANLFASAGSLIRNDSMAYQFTSEFEFDLPVSGVRRIPVEIDGFVPIPRVPRLNFEGFSINRLTLTGAEVTVRLGFENTSAFGITLSDIDYTLEINGAEWLKTNLDQSIRLAAQASRVIEVPLRLNFSEVGSSVYRMLTAREPFTYQLRGEGRMIPEIAGFDASDRIPFEFSGTHSF